MCDIYRLYIYIWKQGTSEFW